MHNHLNRSIENDWICLLNSTDGKDILKERQLRILSENGRVCIRVHSSHGIHNCIYYCFVFEIQSYTVCRKASQNVKF